MLYTLFSWCIIGISSLGLGLVINRMLTAGYSPHLTTYEGNGEFISHSHNLKLVTIMLLGLAALTSYAQAISLITRLGAKPIILICVISLAGYLFLLCDYYKAKRASSNDISIINCMQRLFGMDASDKSYRIKFANIVIVIGLCLLFAMITSTDVLTYDSSLYHAQAIHWIENYGIVPGLGNLYHRLAYNSSFFSLQALFGLRWLLGDSLHSVNGFVAWILVSWSICTIFSSKSIAGKLLRILLIWFLTFDKISDISSPNSDVFVLSLVIFIFINWIENTDSDSALFEQSVLCLLAVFAFTLKLSAALMVVLAIVPAFELIRCKKYKFICILIIMGMISILPFLARNYLISGYLLYPYPQIDLFNVDWKMSPYMSAIDAAEIKMWGRGIPDVMQINTPASIWLQIWLSTSKMMSFLLVIDILAIPLVILKSIRMLRLECKLRTSDGNLATDMNTAFDVIIVPAVAYLNGILWFVGAPLPRYGSIYLFVILFCNIHLFMSHMYEKPDYKKQKRNSAFSYFIASRKINLITLIVSVLMLSSPIYYVFSHDFDLLNEKRIWGCSMTSTETLGTEIFYPSDADDLVGYDNFPATPYQNILDKVELRGNEINAGFRLKPEYKDALIVGNGNIHEKNILKESR